MERKVDYIEPMPGGSGNTQARLRTGLPERSTEIQYPIRYSRTQVHQPSAALLECNRILHEGSDKDVVYAYKMLRTQVLKKLRDNGWNSVGLIGARAQQGATLTAINLAMAIAMDPRHTALLVDLNLRNPAVHRYFGYEPALGVEDILLGSASVESVLFNPGVEGLLVLPARAPCLNSSELLSGPEMHRLILELKQRYASRIIVFDLPPVLEAEDSISFAEYYDAGLLVIADGITSRADIERTASLVGRKPMLGSVFNNAI
ncbi:MAG: CpsD/CapB family tyrosine-protein kinase [Gammaproteobacteria bacterium]|nr:CpsD/CapB family tyrosine-protein kinase [Gammaproteobacteria bacterium]